MKAQPNIAAPSTLNTTAANSASRPNAKGVDMREILVYDSARQKGVSEAVRSFGASRFEWWGRTGDGWAIPTHSSGGDPMELRKIRAFVQSFINYATRHPELRFKVTPLLGIPKDVSRRLFRGSPENVILPEEWKRQGQKS